MLVIICLAGLALLGIGVAAAQYPWREPVWRPHVDIIALLITPLVVMVIVQSVFGLPAGACVERPLNNAPLVLTGVEVVLGIAAAVVFPRARRFAIALAVGLFPITLGWAFIATMSLAGCWI